MSQLAGLVAVLALVVPQADASPCGSPRAAAATIFSNLREDQADVRRALRCAESNELSPAQRERALRTLKAALDAVGGRVRLDELSADAAYIDPRSFEPMVTVARELPRFKLQRMDDGQWMIPGDVLEQADEIYDRSVTIDLAALKRKFPSWAQRRLFGVAPWQGLFLALLLVVGVLARQLVVAVLLWRTPALVDMLKLQARREELRSALLPVGTLALLGVVALGAPSLGLGGRASFVLLLVVRVAAVLAALTFAWRAVDVGAEEMRRRAEGTATKMDDHIVPLVRRMLKIAVVALAGVLVLQAFDVNVGSLVAGLGIGGLAVALAAKDTIGNFFGSVAILLDRPFQIGDWVVTPDVQGTIEQVGFRSTQIRTIRDTVVSVPNAKLADSVIDNSGARRFRYVGLRVGLQYDTTPEQIEAFCDGVRAIIAAHPHTRKDEVQIHFHDFQDSALAISIQFYLVAPAYGAELRIRHEVLLDVVRLAKDLGVRFAFPTRTLHVDAEPSASPSVDELLDVIKGYGPGGVHARPSGPRILPGPPTEPAPAPQQMSAPPRSP